MEQISTIGLDIAKTVFQVHANSLRSWLRWGGFTGKRLVGLCW